MDGPIPHTESMSTPQRLLALALLCLALVALALRKNRNQSAATA